MIEDIQTGETFPAEVSLATAEDARSLGPGWNFQWLYVILQGGETYKLRAPGRSDEILGLMAITRQRGYIEIDLLESGPQHVGRRKQVEGIAGTLIAHAARLSFAAGNSGFVTLTSKTRLIKHYARAYGFARHGKSHRMYLDDRAAFAVIATFDAEIP